MPNKCTHYLLLIFLSRLPRKDDPAADCRGEAWFMYNWLMGRKMLSDEGLKGCLGPPGPARWCEELAW